MSTPSKLTDQELIEELKDRFDFNRKALQDLAALTKKLEEVNSKLQDSEALKSHFLSNIRNEINNPLTSIMGLSRQLMEGNADPQKATSTGSLIYFEAFTLDFQLRNIFMAAELEAGEAVPAFAHVDICSLVTSALEMFDHQADLKKLDIVCSCARDLLFTTDAQKLQVMLHNLLANAIEYSGEGGKVEVTAEISDERLRIVVRDSGGGIEEKDREAIFDRFKQLEAGTTKSHPGHGLGLS
nr:HAMP domain-containing histidine kinase [Desulfuromonadales bacterium]NIR33135.1 HAMP domain-containing histidine kinase [Desulfuromonadales bacterium]NIS43122.1 HAMP domain-containing histidine kinase [Desulfuromonadales bacterium]